MNLEEQMFQVLNEGEITEVTKSLIEDIANLVDKKLPKLAWKNIYANRVLNQVDVIYIMFAASDVNINNVKGQKPQKCHLMLNVDSMELTTNYSGQVIYREPNMDNIKEQYLAMQSIKIPFRKPKPDIKFINNTIIKFIDNWIKALKDNKDVLMYQDIVDYNKLLK